MTEFEKIMSEAQSQGRAGRYEAAFASFSSACALAPEAPHAWCNLGGVAFLLGQPDLAEQHYQHALTLQPGLEEARYGIIRIQLVRREWKTVLEQLDLVKPELKSARSAEWNYLRGIAYEGSANTDAAVTAYHLAAEASYAPAQKALARLLLQVNRPEEAVAVFFRLAPAAMPRWTFVESCLKAHPSRISLYDAAARHFLDARQFAYAARTTARALKVFPNLTLPDWPGLEDSAWF